MYVMARRLEIILLFLFLFYREKISAFKNKVS
jgi:hypothetical protein